MSQDQRAQTAPQGPLTERQGEPAAEAAAPAPAPLAALGAARPWLLGGLAASAAVQTALAGRGGSTAVQSAAALDLVATLALLVVAVLAAVARLRPGHAAVALAVAAAAAALDASATGSPAAAGSVVLVLLGAELLAPSRLVLPVGGIALAGWTASTLVAIVAGRGGHGPAGVAFTASGWVVSTAVVAAGAAAALGLRRLVESAGAEVARAREAASAAAVSDPLTGTANRRGLELIAQPMLDQARRQGQAVHCLFLDVDGFATVNQVGGSSAGDEVLTCVADALLTSVRSTDVVARWSGDQFVVIGPGTGSSPLELERRVKAQLALAPVVSEEVWPGRVSIGSATLVPWDDGDLESVLRRATQDMNLRRTLRRQGAERNGGSIASPPSRPMPGRTDR